jgi:Ca2+-dependent lipid-binding protein
MSKLDRLKEEIAYQKYYLSVAIAIVVGLSGWLGVHVKSADSSLIIAGSIVVITRQVYRSHQINLIAITRLSCLVKTMLLG